MVYKTGLGELVDAANQHMDYDGGGADVDHRHSIRSQQGKTERGALPILRTSGRYSVCLEGSAQRSLCNNVALSAL